MDKTVITNRLYALTLDLSNSTIGRWNLLPSEPSKRDRERVGMRVREREKERGEERERREVLDDIGHGYK